MDVAEVVSQRPNLRRFLRLMYPPGRAAAARGIVGGRAQPKLSSAERQLAEETAIAEWRAAAARPVEQQGHSWGAAAALAAALVQARPFRVVSLATVVVA